MPRNLLCVAKFFSQNYFNPLYSQLLENKERDFLPSENLKLVDITMVMMPHTLVMYTLHCQDEVPTNGLSLPNINIVNSLYFVFAIKSF